MNSRLRDQAPSKGAVAHAAGAGQRRLDPANPMHTARAEHAYFSADTLSVVLEGRSSHRYSVCMPNAALAQAR